MHKKRGYTSTLIDLLTKAGFIIIKAAKGVIWSYDALHFGLKNYCNQKLNVNL